MGQESSGDGWFWLRANNPVNKFSILEDEHGWNTLNLELSSRARVFIDIQLGHAVTTICSAALRGSTRFLVPQLLQTTTGILFSPQRYRSVDHYSLKVSQNSLGSCSEEVQPRH